MSKTSARRVSRRDFARSIVAASAVTVVPPSTLSLPAAPAPGESFSQQPPSTPALSAEGQAEAEARYQTILKLYGPRFSDAQKADLRRLCFAAQPSLDRLRAGPVSNGDNPALYLKPLVEREKKVTASPPVRAQKQQPKNP